MCSLVERGDVGTVKRGYERFGYTTTTRPRGRGGLRGEGAHSEGVCSWWTLVASVFFLGADRTNLKLIKSNFKIEATTIKTELSIL